MTVVCIAAMAQWLVLLFKQMRIVVIEKSMKKRINTYSLWLLLILPMVMKAQSVDKLLDLAVTHNLELKVLENEYFAALEKAPQVNQLPDPEVGAGAFPFPVETRLGQQTARLSATQMFPWFGTLDSKANLENAKAKALYERIGAARLNVFYNIKIAYFRLYEIQQSQSIIRNNITILEALEQLALSKAESGKTTAANVLSVQLKLEELKQEIKILETAKVSPTATINQLLNRDLQLSIITQDSLAFATIPFDKESLVANIKANHPMLRMYELQQEVSQQAIALNELNGKPSIGLGLDYIMVNQRQDVELERNGRDILQLRASVKIPLYRQKYAAKEREENLKITALDNQKADLLSRFSATIEKVYADYATAQIRMELYAQQIEITQAAIRILETDYSARGNDFDELLRLEKELIDYDLKMLSAIVQSHIAKSSIKRFIIQ